MYLSRLIVVGEPFRDKRGRTAVACECVCGGKRIVSLSNLKTGRVKSCGCLHRERASLLGKANAVHGESHTAPEYRAWASMLDRCYRQEHEHFDRYGGRGITVCEEWRRSYSSFLGHIGRRPSPRHSLDRINNDGGYVPGNVRWATDREQNRNRAGVVRLEHGGILLPVTAWADRVGIAATTIKARITRGWSIEQTLFLPPENKVLFSRDDVSQLGSGYREWVPD